MCCPNPSLIASVLIVSFRCQCTSTVWAETMLCDGALMTGSMQHISSRSPTSTSLKGPEYSSEKCKKVFMRRFRVDMENTKVRNMREIYSCKNDLTPVKVLGFHYTMAGFLRKKTMSWRNYDPSSTMSQGIEVRRRRLNMQLLPRTNQERLVNRHLVAKCTARLGPFPCLCSTITNRHFSTESS